MTGIGRLELVAFDARDVERLAAFYGELAGWTVTRTDVDWIAMRLPDGREVAFQLAPDHVPPSWPGQARPQQLHLDLAATDHRAAAERALTLGATRLADGPYWVTLADPAGHPFDLVGAPEAGLGDEIGLRAIGVDVPDAAAAAAFYGPLLGLSPVHEAPTLTVLAGGGHRIGFQQVEGYNAPRWPDPAFPQQAHLDVIVDDLDAGGSAVLALGATLLDDRPDTFRVFADPAGHPFCLCVPD